MKDLLIKRAKIQETSKASRMGGQPKQKVITGIKSKAPACACCEIPILITLARTPETGMRTKDVLEEVRTKFFDRLNSDDCEARYPVSRRRIVESVMKFSKKNLVLKQEVFPVGEGLPVGTWKVTEKGLARVRNNMGKWTARYSNHDGILIREVKS